MKLNRHPEYEHIYQRHRQANERCRRALADWQAGGASIPVERYGLSWTYESAQAFARALSRMFQAYNQVMWEQFPYCRPCSGQCCVLDASDIRPFDLIAVALLDLSPPLLPAESTATPRDCIYLVSQRCTWPDAWRTIKCWSFYCLGSGPWGPAETVDELYRAVSEALKAVARQGLPEPLRRYEAVRGEQLADHLDDPVHFADRLHDAIFDIFVGPLQARYPFSVGDPAGAAFRPAAAGAGPGPNIFLWETEAPALAGAPSVDDALAFIAGIAEQATGLMLAVPEETPGALEQLLADLESLEWIIVSRPAQAEKLLAEMYHRYVQAPEGEEYAGIWAGMRRQIWRRWHHWI